MVFLVNDNIMEPETYKGLRSSKFAAITTPAINGISGIQVIQIPHLKDYFMHKFQIFQHPELVSDCNNLKNSDGGFVVFGG